MQKLFYSLCFFTLLLAIVACGGGEPAVETPLPTAVEQAQAINTPTAAAAAEAQPTVNPTLPPPIMASPAPTATSAAGESAGDPTTGLLLLNPEDFAGRNPLTGEEISDPALLQQRPIAIKISNAPPSFVRPQSGLNDADILFEHITEGNLTRLTAIFYTGQPEKVGPIRSARLIDVELPAMYDAALAYSGSSVGVSRRLLNSDFAGRIISGGGGYYRSGESKPYEHTLYATLDGLRASLGAQNTAPEFTANMAFSSAPPAGGTPATDITINFLWEEVNWAYDPATNRYLRTAAGVPHLDGNSGAQVSTRNIVVPFVNHVDDATICEEIRNDRCHLLSVEIQLWGQGPVVIFRDGQRFEGTWIRDGRTDMLTFFDAAGNPIPLQIGNTWVELMSLAYPDPLTVE